MPLWNIQSLSSEEKHSCIWVSASVSPPEEEQWWIYCTCKEAGMILYVTLYGERSKIFPRSIYSLKMTEQKASDHKHIVFLECFMSGFMWPTISCPKGISDGKCLGSSEWNAPSRDSKRQMYDCVNLTGMFFSLLVFFFLTFLKCISQELLMLVFFCSHTDRMLSSNDLQWNILK